jgi:ABC-type lipoprotein release transport system permease subunit
MWMNFKLAWRNLFRNKRRTAIAATAIGIGLAALIFFDAVMIGTRDSLIRSTTDSFLGQAQIHRDGYRNDPQVKKTINGCRRLMAELGRDGLVEGAARRVLSPAMIASPAGMQPIQLVGVDPASERRISRIAASIQTGDFFREQDPQAIVIGSKLAEDLEVAVGDRLVVTVSETSGRMVSQELFRVGGVYRFAVRELDSGMAFILYPRCQKMLGLGDDDFHEIALRFRDIRTSSRSGGPFWSRYSRNGNEAVGWKTLMPQMTSLFDNLGALRALMGFLLLIVVVFGIINTLFMSFYERMFEFAVLRALGTRPSGIRRLMLFEAGALGIVSGITGIVLGIALLLVFRRTGIDYRGIEFAGGTIRELVRPVAQLYQFTVYPAAVFAFTCVVGIYPAFSAGRMKISEALRKSI